MNSIHTDKDADYWQYHSNRTLKKLQDEMDRAKSTKLKVEIAEVIDKLLYTQVEKEKIAKLKEGWGE